MADYTNNVIESLVGAGGVIDLLELEVSFFTKEELAFLAAYQTKLGSANSTPQEDLKFLMVLERFMTEMAAGRSGVTA